MASFPKGSVELLLRPHLHEGGDTGNSNPKSKLGTGPAAEACRQVLLAWIREACRRAIHEAQEEGQVRVTAAAVERVVPSMLYEW